MTSMSILMLRREDGLWIVSQHKETETTALPHFLIKRDECSLLPAPLLDCH